MTNDHVSSGGAYLELNRAVLFAGRTLRDNLEADQPTLDHSISQLEQSVERQESGEVSYRTLMFSELEAAAGTEEAKEELIAKDVLASVLTDLEVANLLMAAGEALGETGEEAKRQAKPHLDEALRRVENTTDATERSLAQGEPGRRAFAEEAVPAVVQSTDLTSAIQTCRRRSDESLTALVTEAQGVVTSITDALLKLDSKVVLAALSKLGKGVESLPKMGRLFRWGVRKLERAISVVIRLLGNDALGRVTSQVKEILEKVKDGKLVAKTFEWAFGIDETRDQIAEVLSSEGLQQGALDEASNALGRLAVAYKDNMAIMGSLSVAVALAGTLLAFTPLAGPAVALAVIPANLLILAAVILIGIDYADSGGILRRVAGVGEIVGRARPG